MEFASSLISEIEKKNILLVEGPEEINVLYHLLKRRPISSKFEFSDFKDKGGVDALIRSIPAQVKGSEIGRIGIIVDADEDIEARWRSITARLHKCGYRNVPRHPDKEGTIITNESLPIAGVWLMPDNRIRGALEEFIGFLIPGNDELWAFADEVVNTVLKKEQRFIHNHTMKAKLHTWLAWQEIPGTPIGLAITRRYLETSCLEADQFLGWLERLFTTPLT